MIIGDQDGFYFRHLHHSSRWIVQLHHSLDVFPFFRIVICCIYACLTLVSDASAQSDARQASAVDLDVRVLSDAMVGKIVALRDPDGSLAAEAALDLARAGRFEPVVTRTPDFGFTHDKIWLYLNLNNPTSLSDWRLRIRENFFQEFSVWHVTQDGTMQQIEFQDETTGFATRSIQWPELVAAFQQPPGTTGELLIRYRSGGSTEMEPSVFEAAAFAAWSDRMTARNFIYYGMLIFLIVAATITWGVTRRGIFIAYSSYAFFGLLFVMHADGNAFRYLWPDAPGFNSFATVPLGVGIVVFGANFARQFLQTADYHPVFDRILLGTIVFTLALGASSIVVDTQLVKKLLVLMAFFSVLLFLASGLNAARTRMREVRFFVIAWSGAVISSAIMTGRHWLGFEISEELQFNSMRIVFVLDAALMGLAILDRFNTLRRSRSRALEASLEQAERNLSLSQRLQTLEQRYAWAAELTRNREEQVADVIHDLRQPLHALRLKVQSLLQETQGPASDLAVRNRDIDETFTFLEKLVTEELDGQARALSGTVQADDQVTELNAVLQAVTQMFADDAEKKGLVLRVGATDARVRVPAVAVMRVLSNLVSNAVRFTDQGWVSVDMTWLESGALRIEVADTGPGMSAAEFEAALPRAARLDKTGAKEGSGLGLAIIAQTCAQHGLAFERLPPEETGTRLGVTFAPDLLGPLPAKLG
jgi:signal transduction histidine kinase